MPSSATITAFYTFAERALIRSSEHNNNFSVFRGHFLPVHPDTATAATSGAYDLGSSDHRWGTLYVTTINSTNAVGGGGGGGGIIWEEPANAPVKEVENNAAVYKFLAGASQELYTEVHVPSTYTAGNPIALKIKAYSPDTSGNILLRAQATLIRAEVDDIASTTNQRTTTNAAITMSSSNDSEVQKISLDISSSIGEINSVAISASDTILVRLYRDTDTATSDVRFLPKQCEVTFS
jgi:hypothetical protein